MRDVALTSALPHARLGLRHAVSARTSRMVDRANAAACFFKMVSPSYFPALGIEASKGRALTDRDVKGAPRSAVINETMAQLYFADEDPIGKRILVQEIVRARRSSVPRFRGKSSASSRTRRSTNVDSRNDNPGMYVSNEQSPRLFPGADRARRNGTSGCSRPSAKPSIAVNKDQTLPDIKTLEQIKTESMATNRLRSMLLAVFASIAVLLSAIGIYGVISYSVVQRTREIGIRAALGASRSNLLRLILRSGMLMAGLGLVLGFAGAVGLTRLLSNLLFGVGERDPMTITTVAVVLASVALLACYIPARRATKVDPMVALRYE